jgi:hypothetical protein
VNYLFAVKVFCSCVLGIIISGCAAAPMLAGGSDIDFTVPAEYISIEPGSSPWFETETAAGVKRFFWADLKNDEINKNLPLERSFASIERTDGGVGVGFLSAKATAGAGKYKITLDYAKYRDEVIGEQKVPCRIGVGVRVIANVVTYQANIDLGSLFAIGVAAQAKKINGQIEVIKIGIDSSGLNLVLPPPSDINEGSLQMAMQAVAATRIKIYDATTALSPHVLAVRVVSKAKSPGS